MQRNSSWLALLLLVTTTSLSAATPSLPHQNESALSVSRYIDVMPGPTNAQRNPMNLVLPRVMFKHNIKSVGQAINYLLSDSGFKLTRHHPDKRVHKLFRLPLPKIHRNMGPLTLAQALNVLAGEPWQLSVDPINRLVSFQLPGHFRNTHNQSIVEVVSKSSVTKVKPNDLSKHQVDAAQKQYKRVLESKRRALLDRKNKQRLVRKKTTKKRVKKAAKKTASSIESEQES